MIKQNSFFNILKENVLKVSKQRKNIFFKKKVITLTGASGLIGVNLIVFFYLLSKTIYSPKKIYIVYKSYLPEYFNFLKKDKKFAFIKKDLAKSTTNIMLSDIVIHGAGYAQPQKFIENSMQTLLLNSLTTYELLKKTKKNGSFIFLSSSEIYSGLIGNIVEERTGLTNTLHPRACYIEGKRFGETLINTFKNKHNINAKAVRVCLAYGPGVKKSDKRVMSQFIDKALTEKEIQLLDSGSAIRSYVYISDVIKMIIDILINGKDTIYNVGGKSKITIYQLAKEIGKITNVKVVRKKEINKNSAPKSAFVSSRKYEKEFGKFKLTSFFYGISKTIKWQKLLKFNLK